MMAARKQRSYLKQFPGARHHICREGRAHRLVAQQRLAAHAERKHLPVEGERLLPQALRIAEVEVHHVATRRLHGLRLEVNFAAHGVL